MIRLVVLGLCLVVTGCYSPRLDPCKITCTEGCPPGWACAGDGFCHDSVNEPACNEDDLPPPVDGGRPRIDASGKADAASPDAAPVDAGNGADAACVVTPLLMNPGFDLSTGTGSAKVVPSWTTPSSGVTVGDLIRTTTEMGPPQNTQAGGYAGKLGGAVTTDHRVCQGPITIPAGTDTLRTTGFVWVTTTETQNTKFDYLDFKMYTTDAIPVFLEVMGSFDNRTPHVAWTAFSVNATTPHAGQTVQFCAVGISDVNAETVLRFDTLQLEAVDCP